MKKKQKITHNEYQINQANQTHSELSQILELAEKNIKTVFIIAFFMFKKLSGDMEDIKDDPKV